MTDLIKAHKDQRFYLKKVKHYNPASIVCPCTYFVSQHFNWGLAQNEYIFEGRLFTWKKKLSKDNNILSELLILLIFSKQQ